MTEYMIHNHEILGFKSRTALETYITAGLSNSGGKSKRISKTAIDKFMAEHQSTRSRGQVTMIEEQLDQKQQQNIMLLVETAVNNGVQRPCIPVGG